MKFAILGIIFTIVFLTLYLTISWWQRKVRQENPKTKDTEPVLPAVPKQDPVQPQDTKKE